MAAKWILRWQYEQGSIPLFEMSHDQSRVYLKESLDVFVREVRERDGCDISHRQVTSGSRIRISFGLMELHVGNGLFALGRINHRDRSKIWLLGHPGRSSFRSKKVLGYTVGHESMHCASVRMSPSADSQGHSVVAGDIFNAAGGQKLLQSLGWWRGLGGIIKGWKPKVKQDLAGDLPIVGADEPDLIMCGCCHQEEM